MLTVEPPLAVVAVVVAVALAATVAAAVAVLAVVPDKLAKHSKNDHNFPVANSVIRHQSSSAPNVANWEND